MFDPENLQCITDDTYCTMMWCDSYLEARLIQDWYSSLYPLHEKPMAMVMADLAGDDYCVLVNCEYQLFKTELIP
tara:strand:- start:550 stop:774 length:225 start_codon:yes stop_codon:yes gene_type:complete